MKTTFVLLSFVLLLVACTDVNQSKHLASLDRIQVSADSLKQIISKHPTDSSFQMAENIRGVELRFKQYFYADSIDQNLANDINDLKQARKTLSHLHNDCLNLIKGSDELKESVRLLRYDIDNADGDRKKYDEYVAHEEAKLAMLSRMGGDYMKQREASLKTYDNLFSELNLISLDLLEANQKTRKKNN